MNKITRLVIRNALATTPPAQLVITILLPVLILFMMGFSFSELIPPFKVSGREVPYQAFLAAGVIAMTAVESSLVGGSSFWFDRNFGMMEQILVGPFSSANYLLSKVIWSVLLGLASAGVIAVLAIPFLSSISVSVLGFFIAILAVFSASFFFGAFSMILASVVKSEGTYNAIMNLLFIVLMFASSTFYPLESAPGVFRAVFLVNPLTYVADIIRFGLFGLRTSFLIWEAVVLLSEVFVIFFSLLLVFKRTRLM